MFMVIVYFDIKVDSYPIDGDTWLLIFIDVDDIFLQFTLFCIKIDIFIQNCLNLCAISSLMPTNELPLPLLPSLLIPPTHN